MGHIFIRILRGGALELDEAEQLIFSQWLLPGYSSQPPLYTWLQFVFVKIFGKSVLAVSLLKNALLFLAYTFLFFGARKVYGKVDLARIVALSPFFILQISWGAQRDLTHSVLLFATESATFFAIVGLLVNRSIPYYGLLGLFLGLGFLSKASFGLFSISFIIALATTKEGHLTLLNKRSLSSLAIVLLVTLPYDVWAFSHIDIAARSVHKLHLFGQGEIYRVLGKLFVSCIAVLSPFFLVFFLIFGKALSRPKRSSEINPLYFPLLRYFPILLGLLVILVAVFDVTRFKNRWLAPLLVIVPVAAFQYLNTKNVSAQMIRRFTLALGIIAIGILSIMGLRNTICPKFGYFTDLSYPSSAIAQEARHLGYAKGIIIASSHVAAANLLMQFPRSIALHPGLSFVPPEITNYQGQVLLLWNRQHSPELPPYLKNFIEKRLGIKIRKGRIALKNIRYPNTNGRIAKIGLLLFEHHGLGKHNDSTMPLSRPLCPKSN